MRKHLMTSNEMGMTDDPDRRAIASGNGSYFNNTMLDNSPGAAAMTVGRR